MLHRCLLTSFHAHHQQCHARSSAVINPDSKVHGANMGFIWRRQDPHGPHVCPWTLLSGYVSSIPGAFVEEMTAHIVDDMRVSDVKLNTLLNKEICDVMMLMWPGNNQIICVATFVTYLLILQSPQLRGVAKHTCVIAFPWDILGKHKLVYTIFVLADSLSPNKRQAITIRLLWLKLVSQKCTHER